MFDPFKLRSLAEQERQSKQAAMQPIAPVFDRLSFSEYTAIFVENGFETWEDVLDITENDLEALNVRRGHRRRLQREIANYKDIPIDKVINSPGRQSSLEAGDSSGQPKLDNTGPVTGKRRYRRHPKPDANAPERPPSAYVLFSNQVRDELKSQNLSFTEMAKVVGEKWQQLDTEGREPFESDASELKETYNAKMTAYKKTDEFKEYAEYLVQFKDQQQKAAAGSGNEGKRLRLERAQDGSYGSSRGSQSTPTPSTHGSPINVSQSIMQSTPAFNEGLNSNFSSPAVPSGYPGAFPPSISGPSAARTGLSGPGAADRSSAYPVQHSLPPISTNNAQQSLPRRSQNPAAPFLSRPQDTSSGSSSYPSTGSMSSGPTFGPSTNPDGDRHGSIADSITPFPQSHALKNLNIGSLVDHPGSSVPSMYAHLNAPSPVQPPYSGPEAASRILPPLGQSTTATQQQQQRMDGLSVLALAGRMIDGDREYDPNRDISKPGI